MPDDQSMLQDLLRDEELIALKVGLYAQHEEDAQVRQLLQQIQNAREQHADRLRQHLGKDDTDDQS